MVKKAFLCYNCWILTHGMPRNTQGRPGDRIPRRSLLWRVAAYLLGLSVLTVATLSVAAFLIAESYVGRSSLEGLASLVAAKEDLIETRLQRDRERTSLLTSRTEIVDMLQRGEGDSLDAVFRDLLEEGAPVVGITLFDTHSRVLGTAGIGIETVPQMSARTLLLPLVGEAGWEGHIVYARVGSRSGPQGTLAVRHEVQDLLKNALSVTSLGDTAEVLIGEERVGELVLLHHRHTKVFGRPLFLGPVTEQYAYGSALARAMRSEEGVGESEDYQGQRVFAAYRYLPTFGWGLVVKVNRDQALAGVFALGATLATVGALLVALAAILSVVIARNVTHPLRRLTGSVAKLGPGHWGYRRSVHTGDEVEVLDTVTADLAKRLEIVYDHLEEEIRRQTEALRQQYERDRTILESIKHGVVVVDQRGNVTGVNAAACSLIGCSEECIGNAVTGVLLLHHHKKPVGPAQHPVLRCLKHRAEIRPSPEVRWSVLHADNGTLIPVMLAVTPVLDGRRLIGAIAVFYDITEERRVDYLKSEFIALASHQLRTPLSSLQWYIELFTSEGEKSLSKGQSEYLREMDTAAKRMAKLVDALLHAARLEGQAITPNKQRLDLHEFMEDLSEELRSLAKASKISCIANIPDASCAIQTDPILLHIVFQNLFSNAVKYTKPGGQVEIGIAERPTHIEISISDTGVGIPKKDQQRIFERLFRADNVRQMDTDGSGLGLYISRMVMDTLGGSIRFRSTENKGTIFTVSLPKHSRKTPKKKSSESSR